MKSNKIGGMALFNGILFKNKEKEIIAQKENVDVYISINNLEISGISKLLNIPILRGFINIIKTIVNSVPYIIDSAENIINNNILDKKDEETIYINKAEVTISFIIALFIIFFLGILLPNLISLKLELEYRNIIQSILVLIIFIVYLIYLKKSRYFNELFQYHAAEHKSINAYEIYGLENITLENLQKSSRFHIRCGGNFLIYFVILFIALTMLLPSTNILLKTLIQVLFLPILVGLSYEILILLSNLPSVLKYIGYPAMLIQYITTKEPTKDKLELALLAIKGFDFKPLSIEEYIKEYIDSRLKDKYYERNDIYVLVSFYLNISKEILYLTQKERKITYQEKIELNKILDKYYIQNIPLQYITNKQVFYNEEYFVNENVLIPRQDTEVLVEKAIEYINKNNFESLLDMCTGSGCVGISIANNSNIKNITLVDISKKALEVANENIKINKVGKPIIAICSDLFTNLKDEKKYDIIVSNPPYIKTKDMSFLDVKVKKEPALALDGGEDGVNIYIKILEQAKKFLNDGAIIMFEIGYDELESIKAIILKYREYEMIESIKDLGNNDRVIVCRFKATNFYD